MGKIDPFEALSENQHNAIVALLTCPTIMQAAEECGVGKNTMFRWLREDENFKAAYRAARHELFSRAIAQLQQAAGQAVQTLVELAQPPHSEATRLRAATAILDFTMKGADVDELQVRMERIEQALRDAERRDTVERGNHWPR